MAHTLIAFNERNIVVRSAITTLDKLKIQRLRHQIYCEKLQWVEASQTGLELDEHDRYAAVLGAFWMDGSIMATLRFLTSERQFMLEKEFAQLVPSDYKIRKCPQTAEVTRLATVGPIQPSHPAKGMALNVILKGMYQWSKANGIRYLYFVVERAFLRLLQIRGLPCESIGTPQRLSPKGNECVAVFLDWASFEKSGESKAQAKYANWMMNLSPNDLYPHKHLAEADNYCGGTPWRDSVYAEYGLHIPS